ncbi:glycosyltransferase family 4 protein [Candidatus Villigracilis affinis]|uniref:glycosyltransferase family 4 protein n=1 Tax=Candidatus Villigracilis affinis TaxID=3140682 RepID=UPI001D5CD659|nr:glycosyltransferase family 4 protein [Anaerolineales bacterium]
MKNFPHRLGLQQRVLPSYRVPFFDLLAQSCESMGLFAGQARPVEMIAGGKPQIASYHEAKNIHLFSGAFYLCHQQNFIQWLEEWNPHTLIVEANPRYLGTSSAVNWMHTRGRKVIGWGLGSPPLAGPLAGFRQKSRISFLSKFDALLAYSQRGADEYAALGFPREKIFVAHNSVSPKPEQILDRKPQTVDRATILFVGRLQARKRVDSLLHACAEMESKPRLIIVGDGPERAALESLARDVYPAAEFAGARHGMELKPYFAESDLFVLPGTGGLAVQEAMSYGLPVIVAKGDGTQDDLVRDGNGWQIQPEDYGALVATMKNALSDMARLRKMGEESFRIVSEEINIQKMVEVFVDALNSVDRP